MAIGQGAASEAGQAVTLHDAGPPAEESPARISARGKRTQTLLLEAARTVFERDGYLAARVTDISAEAGVSHGSFYTYYTSKNDIFRAVMQNALDNIYASGAAPIHDKSLSQRERIDLANRKFIEVYRGHTALMALFEQAATIDPEVRALRLAVRARAISRVQKSIERLQREGVANRALDPYTTASSLVAMVNFTVYFWLVMGEEHDEPVMLRTLNELWANGIGLAENA
ncbi:MAG: TetR/AcrR family transcriptional regulator [Nocardioidaceae bacterium]